MLMKTFKGVIKMFEAVISNHKGKIIPATYCRNTRRKLTYNVWILPGLEVFRCGFFTFHDIASFDPDHQLIWADIGYQSFKGY